MNSTRYYGIHCTLCAGHNKNHKNGNVYYTGFQNSLQCTDHHTIKKHTIPQACLNSLMSHINLHTCLYWHCCHIYSSVLKCCVCLAACLGGTYCLYLQSRRFLQTVSSCYQTTWWPISEDGTVPFLPPFGNLYIIITFRIHIFDILQSLLTLITNFILHHIFGVTSQKG
jgi:hypothetical protein